MGASGTSHLNLHAVATRTHDIDSGCRLWLEVPVWLATRLHVHLGTWLRITGLGVARLRVAWLRIARLRLSIVLLGWVLLGLSIAGLRVAWLGLAITWLRVLLWWVLLRRCSVAWLGIAWHMLLLLRWVRLVRLGLARLHVDCCGRSLLRRYCAICVDNHGRRTAMWWLHLKLNSMKRFPN